MSRLTFGTLYSGSSGNSVFIACDDDILLIDAGKSARQTCAFVEELGGKVSNIRGVFVTHEHTDHVFGIPVLSKKGDFPVYIPSRCACALDCLPVRTVAFDCVETEIGPFRIKSFPTPHDSAMSVGYVVTVCGKKLGIATDMGILAKNVVEELVGCYAAVIECNYDPEMLRNGCYPYNLKERIGGQRGHLSNEDGALLAAILAHTGAKHLLLGHLSKENNTPEKALAAVGAEFEKRKVSANVTVASRDCPTVLFDLVF